MTDTPDQEQTYREDQKGSHLTAEHMGLDQAGYPKGGQNGISEPVVFCGLRKDKIKTAQDHREKHHGGIFSHRGSGVSIDEPVNGQGIDQAAEKTGFPAPKHSFERKIADDNRAKADCRGVKLVGGLNGITEAAQKRREIQKSVSVHDAHRIAVVFSPQGMDLNGKHMVGEPFRDSLNAQKVKRDIMAGRKVIQAEGITGRSENGGQRQNNPAGWGIAFPEQPDKIQKKTERKGPHKIFLVPVGCLDDADAGNAQVAFAGERSAYGEAGHVPGQVQCQHRRVICGVKRSAGALHFQGTELRASGVYGAVIGIGVIVDIDQIGSLIQSDFGSMHKISAFAHGLIRSYILNHHRVFGDNIFIQGEGFLVKISPVKEPAQKSREHDQ